MESHAASDQELPPVRHSVTTQKLMMFIILIIITVNLKNKVISPLSRVAFGILVGQAGADTV